MEGSDEEGEDLMNDVDRDYLAVPELDTYEADEQVCSQSFGIS